MEQSNMFQGVIDLYKGMLYTIPAVPKKKEIQGWDLPKKDQKWRRTECPAHFDSLYEELDLLNENITTIDKNCNKIEEKIQIEQSRKDHSPEKVKKFQQQLNDSIQLINAKIERCDEIESEISVFAFEEDRKCTEGIWFMNNGVATYINGDHYHYLNWFKLDVGYPDYRDRDRRWFYHWELCDKDQDCIGQIYGKQRRDGYSYRVMSIIYNRARRTFNSNYGVMSMTKVDSEGMLKKGVDAFLEYPRFFKPQVQSQEDVISKMVFKTPPQKVTYKTRITKREVSLNTLIDCHATKQNAMDGTKRKIIGCDEAAKFGKDVRLLKWFAIGKVCCTLGIQNIIGKILMGSTVNDFESGGADFKEIWEGSNHNQKQKETGRTESWMYRYFVDCADGMEGFVDEYGNSVIETPEQPVMGIDGNWIKVGAAERINSLIAAKQKSGDTIGYYEIRRQFPRVEDDMFLNPNNDKVVWDIEKIHQQIEHNDAHIIENTLHYGYFQWMDGVRDNPRGCVWVETAFDNPMAKFAFAWFPPEQEQNKWELVGGFKVPANKHKGLFTIDPYAAVNVVDAKRGSKAASHGVKKYDFMHTIKHKHIISEYWNRLKDPLLVYEDMIMCCVYFGWGLMPERNVKTCNDFFRNRDYHKYLLQSPSMTNDDYIDSLTKNADAGLANTEGKTRNQLVEYQASWIANYVGLNEKTGQMGFMPFNNTLKDWLAFDVDKWGAYDLTVSSMIGLVGAEAVIEIKRPPRKRYNYFHQYQIPTGRR
jgi:hypothetical protein